uniref:SAM domain-containing protein n=1 Tax=Glossina palpalis gambiensis TaxID=67801 RepID=A0A1B0C5D9_9MUSC
MNEGENFNALKQLLSSWGVENLYDLFKEEGINIEELQMMKLHHINHLLRNHRLGTRIRFEYHLEIWRKQINIPLENQELNSLCFCKPSVNVINRHETAICNGKDDISFADNATNEGLATETVAENIELNDAHSSEASHPSTSKTPNKEILEERQESDTKKPSEEPQKDLSKVTTRAKSAESRPISLRQILRLAGPRGMSIIKYYQQYKKFTTAHRTQLVHTIVDFFDIHDFHLSLNTSHNLENQILNMFPTEKLEYYRTEKRGKIYVKFCNMKRYKRDRNVTKSKSEEPQLLPKITSDNEGNSNDTNCNPWDLMETEIQVKSECISNDGNDGVI